MMASRWSFAAASLGVFLGLAAGPLAAQPAGAPAAPVYRSYLDLPDPEVRMFGQGLDSDELVGSSVVAPDGGRVGTVTDLLVAEGGVIDKVALDPGSALGSGSRHVTVDIARLRRTEETGTLVLDMSAQELRALPAYRQVDDRWEPIPGPG